MPKKQLKGIVVSNKMPNTVVVETERLTAHPKYGKKYRLSKKYKAHCQGEELKIGDKALIEECRPQSKDKKWIVIKN